MRALLASLILALALALAPAHAAGCVPTTSDPQIDTVVGVEGVVARYYAINDCPETGAQPPYDHCLLYPVFGWWGYQETNGIGGLQRADEYRDDTCGGLVAADTIIF